MSDMGKTSLAPDPFDSAALRLDQSFAAPDPFDCQATLRTDPLATIRTGPRL